MKNHFSNPLIHIKPSAYLTFLMLVVPWLNFLSGITIDMYAPSMPSLAAHYTTSITTIQNTMTMVTLGVGAGSIIFGVLSDVLGRRATLLLGLGCYSLVSLIAIWAPSITVMLLIRFVQGIMVASITMGCRSVVVDNIETLAHRYPIAILYTSVAYGLGPVVGPFIGGILQYHFNWQANFIAFALFGLIFALLIALFLKESLVEKQPLVFSNIWQNYLKILKHKEFIAGVTIMGLIQVELMIYPTVAPFVVENVLHKSVLVYGNTALIIGGSYLLGTLINRFLLRLVLPKRISELGFAIILFGVLLSGFFAVFFNLNLVTLMLPIIIVGIGIGFIYPNLMGENLKLFAKNVGVALSVQACILTLVGALGIFLISLVSIDSLQRFFYLYAIIVGLKFLLFYKIYRRKMF